MDSEPLKLATVFVVYPDNHKFLSGEMSFEESSQHQGRMAFALLAVAVGIVAGVWLLYVHHIPALLDIAPFLLVGFLFAVLVGSSSVCTARVHRRLVEGQMVDGKVLRSKAYLRSQKGGSRLWLTITYAFYTPTGIRIEHTVKVQRHDLWKQAPAHLKGIGGTIRRWTGRESLQELAPEPGTPLKVRYVDDGFFRVI